MKHCIKPIYTLAWMSSLASINHQLDVQWDINLEEC